MYPLCCNFSFGRGYIEFKTPAQVTDRYVDYASQLKDMIPLGVSAAVYTQTTDVEGEVNGLMTYDRKVIKIDDDRVTKANQSLCNTLKPTTLSNPTQ